MSIEHLFKSRVNVLRQTSTLTNGIMGVTWNVDSPVYESMKCRIDLLFRDLRAQQFITSEAGKTPDRQGVLFYGKRFTLAEGDRVQCVLGPVTGLFELEDKPEIAVGMSGNHFEVHVREITVSTS